MKKAEIEHLVSSKIRKAVEDATIEAITELKSAGHNFSPLDEFMYEWSESGSEESLKISCSIGVGISIRNRELSPQDSLVQSYIALAESGENREATLLNLLECDIANGGFMQLYDNKGEEFIKECMILLQEIGSKSALQIVKQALTLIHDEYDSLKKYEIFQEKIERLNNRFWDLEESIPELFMRYRQKN